MVAIVQNNLSYFFHSSFLGAFHAVPARENHLRNDEPAREGDAESERAAAAAAAAADKRIFSPAQHNLSLFFHSFFRPLALFIFLSAQLTRRMSSPTRREERRRRRVVTRSKAAAANVHRTRK